MDVRDWRAQFPASSRQKILSRIIEVLTTNVPCNGEEELRNLQRIAVKFEGKIYDMSTSQSEYVKKISLKLLTLEEKGKNSTPNLGKIMQSEIQNQPRSRPVVVSCPSQLISNGVSNVNLARAAMPNLIAENSKFQDTRSFSQKRFQDQSRKENFQSPEIQNQGVPQVQQFQQGFHQLQQLSSQNPQTHHVYQQHQKMFQMERPSHMLEQRQIIVEPSMTRSAAISSLQQNQQQFSVPSQSIRREQQQHWGFQQNQHSGQSESIIQEKEQQRRRGVFQENHEQFSVQSESIVREKKQQNQSCVQQQQQWVSGSHEQQIAPQQQLKVGQPNAVNIQLNQLIAQESSIENVQQHQERPMGQQSNILNSQQHSEQGNMPNSQQHGAHFNESRAVSCESTDVVKDPHLRLVKAMLTVSHRNLVGGVRDIFSAIRMADIIPESAPGTESEAIARKDLVQMIKRQRK